MTDPSCTPLDLIAALQRVVELEPTAVLVRNHVGNLAVLVDGSYIGYIDLTYPPDSDIARRLSGDVGTREHP